MFVFSESNPMFQFFSRRRRQLNLDQIKVTVIVSTGRTGTNFFATLLDRPELGLIAKHEPPPTLGDLGNDFITGRKSIERTKRIILRDRAEIFGAIENKTYIESNSGLIFLLPALKELIPNLKVIHVVRNPIDFVQSGVNRSYRSKGKTFQTYAEEKNWKLRPTDFPDHAEDWSAMDVYERFMWTWAFKNDCAARFVRENPSIALGVRFEDIFQSADHSGFRTIMDFMGLTDLATKFGPNDFKHIVNGSQATFAEPFEKWPSRRKASLERICGPVVRGWDYQYTIPNGHLA